MHFIYNYMVMLTFILCRLRKIENKTIFNLFSTSKSTYNDFYKCIITNLDIILPKLINI